MPGPRVTDPVRLPEGDPMLQGDANLTEQGRIIVERLAEELAELDGEIRGRVRHEREKANAEATG